MKMYEISQFSKLYVQFLNLPSFSNENVLKFLNLPSFNPDNEKM